MSNTHQAVTQVNPDGLLTYKQLAPLIGVNVDTVRRMVRKRVIPKIRISRQIIRFDWEKVKKALEKRTVREIG